MVRSIVSLVFLTEHRPRVAHEVLYGINYGCHFVLELLDDFMLSEMLENLSPNCIGQIDWHGISNHFISHIDVIVEEFEIIGESLNSCAFTNG